MQSKWPLKKLGDHIIESKETNGSSDLNGTTVLSVTNDKGFEISENKTSADLNKYKVVKENYFAYNPYRINVGSIALARNGEKGIVSPAYVVFYTTQDLDPECLFLFLKSDVGLFYIEQGGKGSVRSSLSFEKLQEIEIPLPPPPEQKRIVAEIKDIEVKVQNLKKEVLSNSKQVSYLIQSFWTTVREHFQKFDWVESTVEDICEDPQYGYTASATDNEVGPKMLRITDIQDSKVDWGNVPFCLFTEKDINKYLLKDNDILFARTGATTGKSYFVKNPPESLFASYLIRLRTKKGTLLPEYLYNFFQSSFYWDQILDRQVGSAQPNLNGSKLKRIKIFYPKTLENQQEVINLFQHLYGRVDLIRQELDKKQQYINALMPSILAKAFNGEL